VVSIVHESSQVKDATWYFGNLVTFAPRKLGVLASTDQIEILNIA
jgi:hypothetical protein